MQELDLNSNIDKYAIIITKQIIFNNLELKLNLNAYSDSVIDMINSWLLCFEVIDQKNKKSNHFSKKFKSNLINFKFHKNIIKIIYCLLSGCMTLNTINNEIIDLDIFDPLLEKFSRIDIIDNKDRNIKLRIFNICDNLIIFDCQDINNYKIYELYNLNNIKTYYGQSKINFDDLIQLLGLIPKYIGKYINLKIDIGKLIDLNINRKYLISTIESIEKLNIDKKICEEWKYLSSTYFN